MPIPFACIHTIPEHIIRCVVETHVRWVPCHHGMARPQVADGGDALQVQIY
jgi:hypothetical protein